MAFWYGRRPVVDMVSGKALNSAMSTAHRPTWNPAVGKEVKGGSRQFSTRDVASHTKLKFRQPGQGGSNEIEKRDLKAQLEKAEAEARARKRKAAGHVDDTAMDEDDQPKLLADVEDRNPEEVKRRKLLEAIALDKDDDEDDEESEKPGAAKNADASGESSDEDEDSDEEDEDESAELLRELEKIRRERAEEQARKEQAAQAAHDAEREEQIATANPLLNLQAALGKGGSSSASGSFAVKKRWDDDLIFKNQANGQSDKPSGQFVNDLLRTEFHRKFMHKFIK